MFWDTCYNIVYLDEWTFVNTDGKVGFDFIIYNECLNYKLHRFINTIVYTEALSIASRLNCRAQNTKDPFEN